MLFGKKPHSYDNEFNMKNLILHPIKTTVLFVFLLPIFFVLHGFKENFGFIPVTDGLVLIATYLLASLILLGLFWLILRNLTRAGLITFFVMCFHFFFGSVHDSLKKILPGTFVTKYSFILPAALIVFIFLLVVSKRMKEHSLERLTIYLNSLLLLIIVIDGCLLLGKLVFKKSPPAILGTELTKCESCPKPDVYFILLDEYAGNDELKNIFHFDNSAFEDQLKKRGFRIVNHSYSNYNYTPFSLASILNMSYLQLKDTARTGADLTYAYQQINDSRIIHFFEAHGYKFYNYSVFEFEHQPAPVRDPLLPLRTRLITSQTFLSRLQRDLWFHTITLFGSKKTTRAFRYYNKRNNERIYGLTWDVARQRIAEPKLVYTHLMMPHYPYYYDKNGNELPFERLVEGSQIHKDDYIGYLQYGNGRIINLIDHIRKSSLTPPIIIVMGDHGFRHFTEPVDRKYHFMNLSAVYFPNANYSTIVDSTSSVNLFRRVLNSQFGQHLPILKDSSIYLRD
jgi:hypothetical protein